ncbi:MAG: hypothetical protein NTZ65_00475 [Candidatus Berkelbacteria bacterium]|nr:hypothetical protein [Candidatus Berkelbacteria bacterium]
MTKKAISNLLQGLNPRRGNGAHSDAYWQSLATGGRTVRVAKPVIILLLFAIMVYQLMPQGVKAGYSFQANYDDGSKDAYNALGSRTGSTDTALPDLNAAGYNGTNSLSYSYDGTSTLKYATSSNLPVDKGSIEMKFQKSGYGNNVDQDVGSMNVPQGISYDPSSGYIYSVDTGNNRIIKTKIDGTGWQAFGHYGNGVGQFNHPGAIKYDTTTDSVYVVDEGNNRIVHCSMNGSSWQTLTGFNFNSSGSIAWGSGIDYDAATGYLYISNTNSNQVVKVKMDGTSRTNLGGFSTPAGIFYDAVNDYVYVGSYYAGYIVKTKIDGTGWTTLTAPNAIQDVYYDADSGWIYYSNYWSSETIYRDKIGGGSQQSLAGFNQVIAFDFDPTSQNLYIADAGVNNIIKTQFDGTGWTAYGSYAKNSMKMSAPNSVARDSSTGYMYIADTSNNRIIKTKIDGTSWVAYPTVGGHSINQPTGIFYDQDSGYLFIAEGWNHKIIRTKLDGTGYAELVSGFSYPWGIYYDASSDPTHSGAGYVYVADGHNARIVKTKIDGAGWATTSAPFDVQTVSYDPTSASSPGAGDGFFYLSGGSQNYVVKTKFGGAGYTTYGAAGSGIGQFGTYLKAYYDPTSQYIFIFDYSNYRIIKTQLDGSWTGWTTYGSNGSGVGQFGSGGGVTYDYSSEYIYVPDTGNNRIVRTKIDGTGWQTTNDFTAKEKVLYSAQATDDSRLVYDVASRKLRFYLAYSNKAQFVETPTLSLTDGDWYTVKVSFDKAAHTLAIDLNGVNQATNTYDADWGSLSYGTSFYIGARNGSTTDRWDGMIDDVNISSDAVDTVAPTNPAVAHVYSTSGKTTEFTDTAWGNDLDPYITFSGASDADSGVKGYYLYFGTTDGTDPVSNSGVLETAGAFHYQAHVGAEADEQHVQVPASALTNGSTYYLLIKTQDIDLNVSAAATKRFTYKADSINPSTNPTAIAYNDSGKATTLTTNTWYNYAHPYFELSGAVDTGGSAVKGYYVYFGTSVNADPLTDGTLDLAANYTASATLVNGTTYYMKVKVADNAGNVIPTSDTLFTYRYTNDAPTAPTVSGYDTASKGSTLATGNWYSYENPYFDWIGASSTPGIAGYYVYFGTNASADPSSVGSYQTTSNYQTVTAMTAGQTYYLNLKAKDNASNISANVQFVYKFDNEAPLSNPTTFAGYKTSAKADAMTTDTWYNATKPYFEWDGAQDIHSGVKGYYVYFGTDATATPLTAGSFQAEVNKTIDQVMTSGSTYYFILQTVNNANTPSAKHTYFTYKYDSAAPELSDAINISPLGCSISPTFDMSWQAAVDPSPGSGLATYEYRAGSQGQVHAIGDLAVSVPSYQEGDNVFYLRAKDNAGNTSSWQTAVFCSTGVAQIIDGPKVTAGPASITTVWTSSKPTRGSVVVYEGNEYISEQTGGEFDISHSVKVVGLEPEKAYRYQLKWYDASGNSGMSDWYGTTTSTAPSVKNFIASVVSTDRAVLSWGTTENSNCELKYGKDSPSDTATLEGNATNFSKDLTGLTGGTTYQVRVSARTMDGFPYYYTASFETPPLPVIAGLHFESTSPSSTKVTWTTNVETTSTLFYGEKGQALKEQTDSNKTKDHSADLSGLSDSTVYDLYVQGSDQFGNTAKSDINSFSTPLDTTPPVISDVTVETSNVGLNRQDKAQIAVGWKTNKLATSQVEYGQGLAGDQYASRSTDDKTLTNSHLVIISDLEPNQPYHIRIDSTDKNGNVGRSEDQSVVPGDVQKSLLNVILDAFNGIFGWMHFIK